MPIRGTFYTSEELQSLLGVTKQRVSNLAHDRNWAEARPGLYYAESVEPYLLHSRGIEPLSLPVVSWDWPEGITWAEEQGLYQAAMTAEEDTDGTF